MTSLKSVEFYARRALELAAKSNQFEKWRDDLKAAASCCLPARSCSAVAGSGTTSSRSGPRCPSTWATCSLRWRISSVSWPDTARRRRCRTSRSSTPELLDEYYGIRHALVVTAIPLDDETLRHVAKRLHELTGTEHVLDVPG